MSQPPRISFEFFPPQSLDASFRLWDTVKALAPLRPEFVSVTYGAGGTTRKLTHEAVTTLQNNFGLRVAAHLTCVSATKDETLEIVEAYQAAGITDIVALRGDAPKGAERWSQHPGGFASSIDLIETLAKKGGLTLRCGAYPEPHPDSASMAQNVAFLKRKFEAGASSAITQFFFDPETFLRFRDLCAKEGITQPIIPGILPILGWEGAKKFAARCGAAVPAQLDAAFGAAIAEGRERAFSIEHSTALCATLLAEGVEDFQFYTLNRPELTLAVLDGLGLAAVAQPH